MAFDIHQLDDVDGFSEQGEKALDAYRRTLSGLFHDSPEGRERRRTDPEMGFWADQLIHYGYQYTGRTIPQMTVADVHELVLEIFPRKISLSSPDEAENTIPELIAFWEYLGREYALPEANAILTCLRPITPGEFAGIMNDPSRFGMAKSFFTAGQSAGFDMSNEEDIHTFMQLHNAAQLAESESPPGPPQRNPDRRKQEHAKQTRKRKTAKEARKRNRKRKKFFWPKP